MCSGQFDIEICQFSQRRVFQLYLVFWSWRNISFVGSTPLDPSLTQTLEDGQAFIDLFPNSPTLKTVNIITSKLLQMETNGDQLLKKQLLFFQKWLLSMWHMIIKLDKCDWDGKTINHWSLLNVRVSYWSNQWWELRQSSTGRWCTCLHVMSREMKDSKGELTVWTTYWK